jgi:hypothetical protein
MRYADFVKWFSHGFEAMQRIKVFGRALRTQAHFFVATPAGFYQQGLK